jgi:hypothetical protein
LNHGRTGRDKKNLGSGFSESAGGRAAGEGSNHSLS